MKVLFYLFVFSLRRGRVHISRILNTKTKSSAAQECHQNGEGSPPVGSHGQEGFLEEVGIELNSEEREGIRKRSGF